MRIISNTRNVVNSMLFGMFTTLKGSVFNYTVRDRGWEPKRGFSGTILNMWRLIKKWWVLQQLDKAVTLHSRKSPQEELRAGRRVLLTQDFFILGNDKFPGIAMKSVKRFSWMFWWRRKENSERFQKKLSKRIEEYNTLFQSCKDTGYIDLATTAKGLMMPIPSSKADDIYGIMGLLTLILGKYKPVWTVIVSLVVGVLGSSYISRILE